jgi:hypothetical protein
MNKERFLWVARARLRSMLTGCWRARAAAVALAVAAVGGGCGGGPNQSHLANANQALSGYHTLARYKVQGGNLGPLVSGKDEDQARRLWTLYTQLIPANERQAISTYAVYDSSGKGTLKVGFVAELSPNSWLFAINPDNPKGQYDIADTLIHETLHMLTIGVRQTDTSIPPDQCPTNLGAGIGCPKPGSYLRAFLAKYWPPPLLQEWRQSEASHSLNTFYMNHANDFVRGYAATDPRDDMAETFAAWVLDTPGVPRGAMAKEQFFEGYPEFVAIKNYAKANGIPTLPPPPPA